MVILTVVAIALMPTRWIADRIETAGSEFLGIDVSIGSLSLHVLNMTPSVSFKSLAAEDVQGSFYVKAESAKASLVLKELVQGRLVLDEVMIIDSEINGSVDENGVANWMVLTPLSNETKAAAETNEADEAAEITLPAIRSLRIENSTLLYEDLYAQRQANLSISATGSTLPESIDTTVQISGDVNNTAIKLEAEFSPVSSFINKDVPVFLKSAAVVGDSKLDIDGTVGNLQEFRDLDLTFDLEAPSVEDFATISGIPLPVLPSLQLSSKIERDGDEFILRRFDGVLGDSDINGDVRIDVTTTPVTLYANVISNVLDLDDLAGFFGGQPDLSEGNVEDDRIETADDDGLLLPDKALNIKTLADAAVGAVRFRAQSIESEIWPIDQIDARIELKEGSIVIPEAQVDAAGGKINFNANLDTTGDQPTGPVEMQLQSINIGEILMAAGVDNDSFGMLGGNAKFWVTGDTVSNIMASADGGIFLLMTGGKLDALLVELAGIDLVETLSVLLASGEPTTAINCAYIDVHARSGLAELNRFVLDTDDTVFMATGSIDFNGESLDLILEPHPKDISLLSAQTSVSINGTFLEPTLSPGSALATRVVAAAALATLAAPVAAIIPFIQSGAGDNSAYCDGLATTLNEAR